MTRTIFMVAALALAVTLPAMPAQAQAERTFVSGTGSDSNNCTTLSTPCRHFAAAYAATAADGEIDVLDPANYGSFTITGPVSIEGHGWASISPVAGQSAITINAPGATDKINIIGVVLDGLHNTNTTGIRFNSGGTLNVQDSVIRNFGVQGINFDTNTSNPIQLFVSNALLSDNGFDGIDMSPGGTGTTYSVLDHVRMQNNGRAGLVVQTPISTQTVNVTVSDSVSAGNGQYGIIATSINGTIDIMVRNCTIAFNHFAGLNAVGSTATVRVTRSTITGNVNDYSVISPGKVLSYRDNNIDGNTSGNVEPPSLPYK
jgi:hypothetical protein